MDINEGFLLNYFPFASLAFTTILRFEMKHLQRAPAGPWTLVMMSALHGGASCLLSSWAVGRDLTVPGTSNQHPPFLCGIHANSCNM